MLRMMLTILGICSFVEGLPVTHHGRLYIGPTGVVTPWKSISPESVDCKASVPRLGLELTPEHKFVETKRWSPHVTAPTSGYTCSLIQKRTTCSRSFFGYDGIKKETKISLPSAQACREAFQRFRENHLEEIEHPYPTCHWLGDDTAEAKGLKISLVPVEYNPFSGKYTDHILAGGVCDSVPCMVADRSGYWFNSSEPVGECFPDPAIKIFFVDRNDTLTPKTEFVSLSLQARSFKGACKAKYCGLDGFLLNTNEWIENSRSFSNRYSSTSAIRDCYNMSKSYAYLTTQAIIGQVLGSSQSDALLAECRKVKDKLMLGEPISRTDLQLFSPESEGRGPVYRFFNGSLQVATAKYESLVFPDDTAASLHGYSLGATVNTSTPVLWPHAIRINRDIVDGPNGMFWFRGRLIHPRTWEGRIQEVSQHLVQLYSLKFKTPGVPDIDQGNIVEPLSNWEWTSPAVIRPVAHLTLLESLALLTGGVLILTLCVKITVWRRTKRPRLSAGVQPSWR
ncbi:glycoprotein [Merida virus]|uniref:Glycoprotein n=1 Tax=Merida virus TaxID=1803034 RepID=A0A140DDE0_9RHAB|nr:glycoprotein [Merida virus]AMK38067.1 glycoprotein [Merida virus]